MEGVGKSRNLNQPAHSRHVSMTISGTGTLVGSLLENYKLAVLFSFSFFFLWVALLFICLLQHIENSNSTYNNSYILI